MKLDMIGCPGVQIHDCSVYQLMGSHLFAGPSAPRASYSYTDSILGAWKGTPHHPQTPLRIKLHLPKQMLLSQLFARFPDTTVKTLLIM